MHGMGLLERVKVELKRTKMTEERLIDKFFKK